MVTLNREILLKKAIEISSYELGQKYIWANKIYQSLLLADPEDVNRILDKTKISELYQVAAAYVNVQIKQGMLILTDRRNINLIFENKEKDLSVNFFEINDLAKKVTTDPLEQLIVLGFFMKEESMSIIQAYQALTGKVL